MSQALVELIADRLGHEIADVLGMTVDEASGSRVYLHRPYLRPPS